MRFVALCLLLVGCSKSTLPGNGDGSIGSDGSVTSDGGITSDGGDACSTTVAPAPGLVVTDRGPVHGVSDGSTWAYFAIPYAAPPVAALRWQPPQPHACWSTPIANTTFGNSCLQLDANDATQVIGAEDCLTLNVWTPTAATTTSALPVLVFIHGGGNVQGMASELRDGLPLYDGAALAAQTQSIVVTFDYRLGPMAWLASSSFAAENSHASTGNYGLLDQLAVLGFVQRNIAAFGGNPAQVLLLGQSAGALDVCALVASPLAKGLFASALMESGGCTAATSATAQSFADTFAAKVGCSGSDVAGCLRALDANTIELAFPEVADIAGAQPPEFQPNADGWVLTDVPENVLAAGQHNHVPIIIGSNEDETGQVEVTAYPNGMTSTQFTAALMTYASGNQTLATAVAGEYPASDYGGDSRAAFIALTSDSKFICPARTIARTLAAQQTEPVRRYQYTHTLDGKPLGAAAMAEGAFHGQELLMLFRQLDFGGYVASAGELQLSDAIDGYWSRFAATGDPNGAGAVTWPLYDAADDTVLLLDDVQAAANGVRTTQCDFWAQALGH